MILGCRMKCVPAKDTHLRHEKIHVRAKEVQTNFHKENLHQKRMVVYNLQDSKMAKETLWFRKSPLNRTLPSEAEASVIGYGLEDFTDWHLWRAPA